MTTTLPDSRNTGVAILSRVFHQENAALTEEAARSLVALRFAKADERRMNQLAAKARRGTLTMQERLEAEQYNMVSHMLAYLQAKACGTRRVGQNDAGSK